MAFNIPRYDDPTRHPRRTQIPELDQRGERENLRLVRSKRNIRSLSPRGIFRPWLPNYRWRDEPVRNRIHPPRRPRSPPVSLFDRLLSPPLIQPGLAEALEPGPTDTEMADMPGPNQSEELEEGSDMVDLEDAVATLPKNLQPTARLVPPRIHKPIPPSDPPKQDSQEDHPQDPPQSPPTAPTQNRRPNPQEDPSTPPSTSFQPKRGRSTQKGIPPSFRQSLAAYKNKGRFSENVRNYYAQDLIKHDYQEPPSFDEVASTDSDWKDVRILGKGTYGKVRLVYKVDNATKTKQYVAIKDCRPDSFFKDYPSEPILINRLNAVGCPNVIDVYSWTIKPDFSVGMYTEFCECGELFDIESLYYSSRLAFPERFLWHIFLSLSRALCYMARGGVDEQPVADWEPIFHGDIKPENVLLSPPKTGNTATEYPVLKVSDFGLSYTVSHEPTTKFKHRYYGDLGTRGFVCKLLYSEYLRNDYANFGLAPERRWNKGTEGKFGPAADVYSLGRIMKKFVLESTGSVRYNDDHWGLLWDDWTRFGFNAFPYPAELLYLIGECCQDDPTQRIDIYSLYHRVREQYTWYIDNYPSLQQQADKIGYIYPDKVFYSGNDKRILENPNMVAQLQRVSFYGRRKVHDSIMLLRGMSRNQKIEKNAGTTPKSRQRFAKAFPESIRRALQREVKIEPDKERESSLSPSEELPEGHEFIDDKEVTQALYDDQYDIIWRFRTGKKKRWERHLTEDEFWIMREIAAHHKDLFLQVKRDFMSDESNSQVLRHYKNVLKQSGWDPDVELPKLRGVVVPPSLSRQRRIIEMGEPKTKPVQPAANQYLHPPGGGTRVGRSLPTVRQTQPDLRPGLPQIQVDPPQDPDPAKQETSPTPAPVPSPHSPDKRVAGVAGTGVDLAKIWLSGAEKKPTKK
ncbi:MAG: hypothetical protein M1834_001261 [Cirrosporium novae-zelandiae]|nr:MAG: hypothetical protein M1834_001261 [Cirrosporium novae-zelandiae]